MPKIAVSSCLLGENVRYDGGNRFNSRIVNQLSKIFEYQSFCPEMAIGLGVPRAPIHLISQNSAIHCVGVENPQLNVTGRLQQYAHDVSIEMSELYGYIFKKGSPSCGIDQVKVNQSPQPFPIGVGIYAKSLMQKLPLVPVIDELNLENPIYRENFILRTQLLHLWHTMPPNLLGIDKLMAYSQIIETQFKLKIAYDNQQLLSDLHNHHLASATERYLSAIAQHLPTFPIAN